MNYKREQEEENVPKKRKGSMILIFILLCLAVAALVLFGNELLQWVGVNLGGASSQVAGLVS